VLTFRPRPHRLLPRSTATAVRRTPVPKRTAAHRTSSFPYFSATDAHRTPPPISAQTAADAPTACAAAATGTPHSVPKSSATMASQEVIIAEHGEEETAEGSTRAAWEGSDVTQDEIDWLRRTRRIPEGVTCRLPGNELAPELQPGEFVVFVAHFERGFGLPISDFTKKFFEKFGLQPHHLPANAITTLSAFISFTEGYLGLWPSINLWSKYFRFRTQVVPDPENHSTPKEMTQCGAATVLPRRSSIFPRIRGLESCRKWLRSFFYVKNTTKIDMIGLPKFVVGPPVQKLNWGFDPKEVIPEVNQIDKIVAQLNGEGMSADDLLATFISRRISPLQRRVHKICHMSGRHDPTRMTTCELTKPQIRMRVKAIARTQMPDTWEWGKEPHDRTRPAPAVSARKVQHHTFHADILLCRLTFLHRHSLLCRCSILSS